MSEMSLFKEFSLFCISYFIVKHCFKNSNNLRISQHLLNDIISYLRIFNYKPFDNFVLLIISVVKSKFAYYIDNPNFRGPDLDPNCGF